MRGVLVNVDNFVRAESDRMLLGAVIEAGGVNRWAHRRVPAALGEQSVIRMNRDTLYSMALVDISAGATLTIPEAGDRYVSVMAVNQDHYVNRVFHAPGEYLLTVDEFDTPYLGLAVRILVDPGDRADVAAVNAIQDQFIVEAASGRTFQPPTYDKDSLDATRQALLELARGIGGFERTFGAKDAVDPVRHLIGTAAGWGGLPEHEASYVNVEPHLPVGEYNLTVRDVPVDAFWSISLYNADGFFEPTDHGLNSVNSVTATRNDDDSITVHFGGDDDGPNCLALMAGWNYIVRLYRPRPEILDGSWTFPAVQPTETS
jgi:hypothetical protein